MRKQHNKSKIVGDMRRSRQTRQYRQRNMQSEIWHKHTDLKSTLPEIIAQIFLMFPYPFSSVKVKNKWNPTSAPHMPSWHAQEK
jgi:hypothetical protein